jgi:hypothetical protein
LEKSIQVYSLLIAAINIQTNEKFALKLENKAGGQNLLESEAYVLCYLKGRNNNYLLIYYL